MTPPHRPLRGQFFSPFHGALSARDAGNILAGAAAKMCGLDYVFTMSSFGYINQLKPKNAWEVIYFPGKVGLEMVPYIKNLRGLGSVPYGEKWESYLMQDWGYKNYKE